MADEFLDQRFEQLSMLSREKEGGRYPVKEGDRYFKISGSDIEFEGGRYKSDSGPKKAATKAGSMLFRMIENKSNKPEFRKFRQYKDNRIVKFILTETTKGSRKESKYYEASKIPLKTPKTIERNGVTITYSYKILVKERLGSPSSLPKSVLKEN